jgi:glutathione S-transferase
MAKPRLYVGNRNYSSWSLRAWIALKWAKLDFDEVLIDLDQDGYGGAGVAEVLAVSPSGKVPAVLVDGELIYDSMAIAEWANDVAEAPLLPQPALARAQVRSVMAEIHAGFAAVRRDLSMNIQRRCQAFGLGEQTLREVARLDQIIADARLRFDKFGPYLFGARSLADAFLLPIATRFRTYAISVSESAQRYCEMLLTDTDFVDWERRALCEHNKAFSRANFDQLYLPGKNS